MIKPVKVPVEIKINVYHDCHHCDHFYRNKTEWRDATFKEKVKDFFTWNQEIRLTRLISSKKNWCEFHKRSLTEAELSLQHGCFEDTDWHEVEVEYRAFIKDGKLTIEIAEYDEE